MTWANVKAAGNFFVQVQPFLLSLSIQFFLAFKLFKPFHPHGIPSNGDWHKLNVVLKWSNVRSLRRIYPMPLVGSRANVAIPKTGNTMKSL